MYVFIIQHTLCALEYDMNFCHAGYREGGQIYHAKSKANYKKEYTTFPVYSTSVPCKIPSTVGLENYDMRKIYVHIYTYI